MKKARFSEAQIVAILKESEAGLATTDLCRRHGISGTTFYKWKAKYGGLEVSDVRRIRQLEEENVRPKRIVANQALDIDAPRLPLASSLPHPRPVSLPLLRNQTRLNGGRHM